MTHYRGGRLFVCDGCLHRYWFLDDLRSYCRPRQVVWLCRGCRSALWYCERERGMSRDAVLDLIYSARCARVGTPSPGRTR